MGTLQPFSIGRRNYNSMWHWEDLDIEDDKKDNFFRITKPTIICFGGNRAANAMSANGLCKIVEGLIGLKEYSGNGEGATLKDVDLVGVSYGTNQNARIRDGGKQRPFCDFSEQEEKLLIDNLFLPLFVDNNGKRFTLIKACRNISKLTFFTYCYGSVQLYDLMNKLKSKLLLAGYTSEEIEKIYNNTRQISYAPFSAGRNVPTISIRSLYDTTGNFYGKYAVEHREFLNGVGLYYNEEGRQGSLNYRKADKESVDIYSSKLINETPDGINEHSPNIIERSDALWRLIDNFRSGNANAVSQLTAYALADSVSRSLMMHYNKRFIPHKSLKTLKKELKLVLSNFAPQSLVLPMPEDYSSLR